LKVAAPISDSHWRLSKCSTASYSLPASPQPLPVSGIGQLAHCCQSLALDIWLSAASLWHWTSGSVLPASGIGHLAQCCQPLALDSWLTAASLWHWTAGSLLPVSGIGKLDYFHFQYRPLHLTAVLALQQNISVCANFRKCQKVASKPTERSNSRLQQRQLLCRHAGAATPGCQKTFVQRKGYLGKVNSRMGC
ncbi:hypothetical protein BOX15_Mlig007073g2, partial [Macrostomum lignano]